jgi:hypothetical protein
MAISDVYDFYKRMEDEHIILSFKGVFTEDLLTSILHIIEGRMENMGIPSKKKKRVFNVLVESFQNLYHHIEEMGAVGGKTDQDKSVMIIVRYIDDRFTITTGNFMRTERVSDLRKKLEMVNAMNDEALRELYRSKLESDGRTDKGTAGLGLIDIARKSKNKLGYEFFDVT